MTNIATEKTKQSKNNKKYMLVRYGRMNLLGWFEHNENSIPQMPARVVVKTKKGLELGYLVGQCGCYRAGQFKLNRAQVKKYFENSDIDFSEEAAGSFVRFAIADDLSEESHLEKISEEEIECCVRFIKELNLPMKIVCAEHIFGGERIIFYFMADCRVDFRALVKKLAQEYQTRIEMRQIGSRDEAKMLGDVESCGQECCCKRFLKVLKPVNMRMAKTQKATLDPSKISGYCGRLKCCLRYEDENYTELKKRLPRKNTLVKTKNGQGRVVDTQILTQLVMVEFENGKRNTVAIEEIEIVSLPTSTRKKEKKIADDGRKDTQSQESLKEKKIADNGRKDTQSQESLKENDNNEIESNEGKAT